MLQDIPLVPPADDAQGTTGGSGVERPPVCPNQHAGALPHELCAVAAGVPVGHHLLALIGDSGGQKGGQPVNIFGIGFWRMLHEVQGGGHVPGAAAAVQQQGLGLG